MTCRVKRIASLATLLLFFSPQLGRTGPGSGGSYHTVVVKPDGTVWTWGTNGYGQLGDGTTTQRRVPTQVTTLSDIIAVAAGADHTLALEDDGTVWAWGNNGNGQLGDATTTSRSSPVSLGLTNIVAIAAGERHSLAVSSAMARRRSRRARFSSRD
jgi:alpha-tubulin suppressor-like RCC1 family protein